METLLAERVSNIKSQLSNYASKELIIKYYGVYCNNSIIDKDLLKLELILLENICYLELNEKEIYDITIGRYKTFRPSKLKLIPVDTLESTITIIKNTTVEDTWNQIDW